jgi:hypothetical protein
MMGLPIFLKKAQEAGSASSSDPIVRKPDDGSDYDPLHSAADDLKQALDEGNTKAIAAALRAAFEIWQSEGDQTSEA